MRRRTNIMSWPTFTFRILLNNKLNTNLILSQNYDMIKVSLKKSDLKCDHFSSLLWLPWEGGQDKLSISTFIISFFIECLCKLVLTSSNGIFCISG